MLLALIGSLAVAAAPSTASTCPTQPEPAALTSASFVVPSSADTLLFSAAPSGHSFRYALKITRLPGKAAAAASLLRLKRRLDCNLHDVHGRWSFTLSPKETASAFSAASALQQRGNDPSDIALDGTTIELQRHSSEGAVFTYRSNGAAKEQVSKAMLDILRRHVPASELPRSADWRFGAAGKQR